MNETVDATEVSVGASLTVVTFTVVVAAALWTLKSFRTTVQVMVRLGSVPKSAGLWLGVTKVTESSTCW